ncbi:MAG: DsbA family protein [Candidatus Doudnabacteria bacterium]
MEKEDLNLEKVSLDIPSQTKPSYAPWVVSIIFSAWLIAMGILGAGYLIAQKLSSNQVVGVGVDQSGQVVDLPLEQNIDFEITSEMYVLGSDQAPVTIAEFADYQCPFCGQFHQAVFEQLKQNYIDTNKVKFVFVDFPFLGEESYLASQATACANEQNKFWEFHNLIFENQAGENQGNFTNELFINLSKQLSMNSSAFESCLTSQKYRDQVINQTTQAGERYGISSTPTFIINGTKYEGSMPYENFKQVIDSHLDS